MVCKVDIMHLYDTLRTRSFKSADKLDAVFDALSSNKKEKCDLEVMPVQKVISNCAIDETLQNLLNAQF